MRAVVGSVLATVVVAAGLTLAVGESADAAGPKLCAVKVGDKIKYVVCSSNPGGTGTTGGGGGGAGPTCELTEAFPTYCKSDGVACRLNDPALADKDYTEEAAGPKPEGDGYHVAYESCADGSGRDWFWTTGETVSTEDLALQAFGELTFTPFTMAFSPPTRTFVNLDTWWWADGASTETLVGTSAGTVRALATPDHMEIDPGDGSGVLRCGFVTSPSDTCTYAYRRASVRGTAEADGVPAYPARMRLVWAVSFEDDGNPLELEGLPTVFTSPWQDVAVPVREVQTVVRPRR